MTQGEPNRPKPQKNKKLMLVRYGRMRLLGWFEHTESSIPLTKSQVVIKTRRGLELGEIVGEFNYRGGQFRASVDQVRLYYGDTGREQPIADGGAFIRFATDEDLNEQKHLEASAHEEAKTCQRFIREMNLPMKVVDAEHLFGGERIIIYFTSNGRVDFRDLVRRLAREYQTRIELRQIGSRDEARLVSDYESCGQECCCRRFLKVLEPVNMRMAKLQKATLDPSKISGHCGRLKCCLRYEDQTYRELRQRLPRKNTPVRTPAGMGRVVDSQILTQLVVVQGEDGKREAWALEEIEILDGSTPIPSSSDRSARTGRSDRSRPTRSRPDRKPGRRAREWEQLDEDAAADEFAESSEDEPTVQPDVTDTPDAETGFEAEEAPDVEMGDDEQTEPASDTGSATSDKPPAGQGQADGPRRPRRRGRRRGKNRRSGGRGSSGSKPSGNANSS